MDSYNQLILSRGGVDLLTIGGEQFVPGRENYVNILATNPGDYFDRVTFVSTTNAFETDNHAFRLVCCPTSSWDNCDSRKWLPERDLQRPSALGKPAKSAPGKTRTIARCARGRRSRGRHNSEQGPRLRGCDSEAGQGAWGRPLRVSGVTSIAHTAMEPAPPCNAPTCGDATR